MGSVSGDYWKKHVLSWEASAYYEDSDRKPTLWDRLSTVFRGRLMYTRMETALELVQPHVTGQRVLDIGCASGRFAFQLLGAGAAHVTGIDVSPEAIAAAEARRGGDERLDFRVLDLTDADAELPEVDLVTALGVIEYFDEPTLRTLLEKLRTRWFLLEFPDSAGRRRNPLVWYLRKVYLRVNRCPGVYLYTQDEFRRMASRDDVWFAHRNGFDFATNLPRP